MSSGRPSNSNGNKEKNATIKISKPKRSVQASKLQEMSSLDTMNMDRIYQQTVDCLLDGGVLNPQVFLQVIACFKLAFSRKLFLLICQARGFF